ncbi:hypothetical protein LshimejAT787_2100740 [Lyophyllum shimeji]|uniref:Uncharacterized protein n=1 Tax=Lyophyllum shimeji TaxID=47721 RepID=A0A9P3Q1F6_LYOSH|nr:hypothetical protein LshimejAT787_2100740 [Lyophyllum shimeji]
MGPLPILLGLFFGSLSYGEQNPAIRIVGGSKTRFNTGINFVTSLVCILRLLVVDGSLKPKHEVNYPMTAAAVLMFIIATADIIVEVCQNVAFFVGKNFEEDLHVGGAACRPWGVALFSLFVAQLTLGDVILIYRCFIVWSRAWKVIVAPVLLTLTALGCGVSAVVIALTTELSSDRGRMTPLITTMLVVTLTSNFMSSSLIVFRIWSVHRESTRYKMNGVYDPLPRAIRVTIEAGIVYTISLVVLMGIYLGGREAQHTVSRLIVQIIGIAFNLVISRTTPKYADSHILSIMPEVPPQPMVINKEVVVSRDPPEDSRKRPRVQTSHIAERQRSTYSWKRPELDIKV